MIEVNNKNKYLALILFSFAFEIRLNQTIRFVSCFFVFRIILRSSIFSILFIVDLKHQNISFEGGGASLSRNLQFFCLFPLTYYIYQTLTWWSIYEQCSRLGRFSKLFEVKEVFCFVKQSIIRLKQAEQ